MNNQIQIDLSKAYEGQYITLANGKKYRIGNISFFARSYDIVSYCDELNESYLNDGRNYNGDNELDIVSLSDPIQVQAARIEGMIEAYENVLEKMPKPKISDYILQRRTDLKMQLLNLQNEGNN